MKLALHLPAHKSTLLKTIDFRPLVFRVSRGSGDGAGPCDRGHVAGDGVEAVGHEAVAPHSS